MPFDINDFKSNSLVLDGARPSLFQVILTPPAIVSADAATVTAFTFSCKAASIPAITNPEVKAFYFGREVNLSGDGTTFDPWPVEVYNDEGYAARSLIEKWLNAKNSIVSNIRKAGAANQNSYKVNMDIIHYGKEGDIMRRYQMVGAHPTRLDELRMDWEAKNQLQTFGVTFVYDYWLPVVEQYNSYLGETGENNSTPNITQ